MVLTKRINIAGMLFGIYIVVNGLERFFIENKSEYQIHLVWTRDYSGRTHFLGYDNKWSSHSLQAICTGKERSYKIKTSLISFN